MRVSELRNIDVEEARITSKAEYRSGINSWFSDRSNKIEISSVDGDVRTIYITYNEAQQADGYALGVSATVLDMYPVLNLHHKYLYLLILK